VESRRHGERWTATAGLSGALGLIALVVLARVVYLAFFCPYTLVEDEAWYWEWSRRLEWSYYSKGPGIAWVIALSGALFRPFGMQVSELAVRLPAVLAAGVLMYAVAGMTRDALGPERSAAPAKAADGPPHTLASNLPLLAAAMVLLVPLFQFTALLMTIDMPYLACWGLAAWAGLRALLYQGRWAWIALGAAVGIGFLFKYTVLLLLPGLALFALLHRNNLRLALGWPRWLVGGLALCALGLLPVVVWNAQHDWVTVRHLLGHLDLPGGDVAPKQAIGRGWIYEPRWTIAFIAGQAAVIGPVLGLMLWGAAGALRRPRAAPSKTDPTSKAGAIGKLLCACPCSSAATGNSKAASPRHSRSSCEPYGASRAYLAIAAAPILLFYLGVTFMAEAEANWPVAGYITLFPLAALVVMQSRPRRVRGERGIAGPAVRALWHASIICGVVVGLLALRLDLLAASPVLAPIEQRARELGLLRHDRPLVPLHRLTGANIMARDVDRIAADLAARTSTEPFIIAQHYGRASLLAFYMQGQPTIYCASAHTGGRRTQYNLWRQTSLDDLELLRGRPAVLVGGRLAHWENAFDSVHEYGRLDGETKPDRMTYIGIGYRGFAEARQ
jgi:hypothetical protein